jgi:hypothetical protein
MQAGLDLKNLEFQEKETTRSSTFLCSPHCHRRAQAPRKRAKMTSKLPVACHLVPVQARHQPQNLPRGVALAHPPSLKADPNFSKALPTTNTALKNISSPGFVPTLTTRSYSPTQSHTSGTPAAQTQHRYSHSTHQVLHSHRWFSRCGYKLRLPIIEYRFAREGILLGDVTGLLFGGLVTLGLVTRHRKDSSDRTVKPQ